MNKYLEKIAALTGIAKTIGLGKIPTKAEVASAHLYKRNPSLLADPEGNEKHLRMAIKDKLIDPSWTLNIDNYHEGSLSERDAGYAGRMIRIDKAREWNMNRYRT